MAIEIEHKYLVISEDYKKIAISKKEIIQGYLSRSKERIIRIRIVDDIAFLTIKGQTIIDTRLEFEYSLPIDDAKKLINLCDGKIIHKTRYIVPYKDCIWEVDEFHGDLAPLVIAEIELKSSSQSYELPLFLGDNVTGDNRYYNSNL